MTNYEVTFIVDPVLSGDEIKATAQTYVDHLKGERCDIVHVDEMGLRQLAYPINRRTSGVYYCVEFTSENGELIANLELALRRDERIMRFLTVHLDKYGVKYNEDKRAGKIGKVQKKKKKSDRDRDRDRDRKDNKGGRPAKKEAPAAPKAEAKKEEEE
jgi:small subunit ribosomal protein S6